MRVEKKTAWMLVGIACTAGMAALVAFAAAPPVRAHVDGWPDDVLRWPIEPPPGGLPILSPPRRSGPSPRPGSSAAVRVMAWIERVRGSLRRTRYQHTTVVRESEGVFYWDCSGMAAWILRRAAPRAMQQIGRERPVASDFVRAIERAPVGRAAGGWQRLERIDEALPGDVFAWRRPRGLPSRNTGHVGFVVEPPLPLPGIPGAYAVRVADSTSWGHQEDTRPPDGTGGFGIGTMVFLTDGRGHGTHYGWHGTLSPGYVITPILFGRVTR